MQARAVLCLVGLPGVPPMAFEFRDWRHALTEKRQSRPYVFTRPFPRARLVYMSGVVLHYRQLARQSDFIISRLSGSCSSKKNKNSAELSIFLLCSTAT